MILNGKEAKTVLLSSTAAGGVSGSHQATPIVVLNQNGHPNPMQLLPVFSSARTVTSVAAARPIKVTEDLDSTSEISSQQSGFKKQDATSNSNSNFNGETNNNNKVIYPWHSLVPFLVTKGSTPANTS